MLQFVLSSDILATKEIDDPQGWEDFTIKGRRDRNWSGVVFESSLSLRFYGEARKYLKTIYELKGLQGIAFLAVLYRCSEVDEYEQVHRGKLNFARYLEFSGDECYVTVPLDPEGCVMSMLNRYEEKVFIPSQTTITIPGKSISKITRYSQDSAPNDNQALDVGAPPDTIAAGSGTQISPFRSYYHFSFNTPVYEEVRLFNLEISLDEVGSEAAVSPIFTAEESGDHRFNFQLNFRGQGRASSNAVNADCLLTNRFNDFATVVYFKKNSDPKVVVRQFSENGCFNGTLSRVDQAIISHAVSIPLIPGDEIRVWAEIFTSGNFNQEPGNSNTVQHQHQVTLFDQDAYFAIELLSNFPVTNSRIEFVDNCFNIVSQEITGGCLTFKSDYFGRTDGPNPPLVDGPGSMEVLTKGLFLRQNPLARFSLSLKELFDGLRAIHNIGMGIEEVSGVSYLRVEPVKYFFEDDVSVTFEDVESITTRFDESLCATRLSVGYSKWEAEAFSGLDEFNSTREYSNEVDEIRSEIKAVSDLIASQYAIEVTRRQDQSSADYQYDQDVFILCVERTGGGFQVEQGNIDMPLNMNDPATVINYRISPARNAIRWYNTMMVAIKDAAARILYFKNGNGNFGAQGLNNSGLNVEVVRLSESQGIQASDINADAVQVQPFITGEVIEFEVPIKKAQFDTIRTNPYKKIQVRQNESQPYISGWVSEFDFKPSIATVKFKLLKSAS